MGALLKRLVGVVLVATGFGQTAAAEDLIMPFACAAQDGAVQLAPSAETTYKIVGARQEQIFAACRDKVGGCENLMVHRFAIQCGNAKVSWSHVVQAASRLGIEAPQGLPQGFAPAATLKARFVFPALARFNPFRSEVETEQLSAESVIEGVVEHDDGEAATRVAAWRTEVRADIVPQSSSGALRVGTIVSFLMALLLAASLIAAGRLRLPQYAASRLRGRVHDYAQRFASGLRGSFDRGRDWMRRDRLHEGDTELANAAAVAMARLIEAELHVAMLPSGLLLREVLLSELDRVRERLNGVQRDLQRRSKDQSAGMIRAVLRELERIGRIAHGAGKDQGHEAGNSGGQAPGMPQSVTEAYRVLGINADAEPAVTKKLVDALRMSWHPDYARDETDRQKREDRIKQINAAWDLIKEQRKAA